MSSGETLGAALRARLLAERRPLREAATAFEQTHADDLERYRGAISEALRAALDRLAKDVETLSGGNPLCGALVRQAGEYVDWLQWTFWDLPHFALETRPKPARFGRAVAASGLVYLAIRVLDDLLDRHFWYRGRHATLLAERAAAEPAGQAAEGLTMLAAFLLCFEGLERMLSETEADDAASAALARDALRATVGATRRVLVGMIMEESDREQWSEAFYEQLVTRKNVDYWRSLHAAVDPRGQSPLTPFLERYYALAQKINDLQDVTADEARSQPNLVSILRPRPDGTGAAEAPPVMPRVEARLAADFVALLDAAAELEPVARGIAETKLSESLEEACRLGLFATVDEADDRDDAVDSPGRLGLTWDVDLEMVTERAGLDAIVEVACPVCQREGRRRIMTLRGFTLHRCLECFHAYVSPRLRSAVQARIAAELDEHEADDFLDVQRIYAEPLCRRLRKALDPVPGRGWRLLDIGFGGAHLMHTARAYGFSVYGLDSSSRLIDAQRPSFGDRLAHDLLDPSQPLPWGNFDVVVMSHVVEHLADPCGVLERVHDALVPGGVLYVAVPDMGSVQFQLLGERWNVMNPLVHFQFFNQASLERLLGDAGFEIEERIEHPPFRDDVAPPWMKLLRDLGGSESGELAMLARRPRAAEAAS